MCWKSYFFIILLFASCKENAVSSKKNAGFAIPEDNISNNIQLNFSGVQVSRALLLNEDGSTMTNSNTTEVNKPLKLRVFVNSGWVERKGKVSLGAYQKIETFKQQIVLEEKDLFENIGTISTEEAKMITITANINKIYRKQDSFLVSFKIWDKNGTGQIEGSYKMVVNSLR
jgi:hypothetical protein